MSRSFKKTRVCKDNSKFWKTLSSRIFRRKTKSKITLDTIPVDHKKDAVDQYSVSDWRIFDESSDISKRYFGKGKKKTYFK